MIVVGLKMAHPSISCLDMRSPFSFPFYLMSAMTWSYLSGRRLISQMKTKRNVWTRWLKISNPSRESLFWTPSASNEWCQLLKNCIFCVLLFILLEFFFLQTVWRLNLFVFEWPSIFISLFMLSQSFKSYIIESFVLDICGLPKIILKELSIFLN